MIQRQITEITKHGAAAGEAGRPGRADWTIDQGWENYTPDEHAVWKTLFERQTKLLPGRACKEFVQGMRDLPIGADQIPDFRRLSDVLMKHTGWQVVAVPGLVPDEVFFGARGALVVVDPAAMERLEEFKLGSHPESFQLERDGPRIFVNLPDQESIGVIDQKTGAVTKWKIPGHANAHALALDEAGHRLFAASLQPGRLTVVDTQSGRVVVTLPCILGVDDLWFDQTRKADLRSRCRRHRCIPAG